MYERSHSATVDLRAWFEDLQCLQKVVRHIEPVLRHGLLQRVQVSVRQVKVAMASACPYQHEHALARARLCHAAA
jgi:hypothetical protein